MRGHLLLHRKPKEKEVPLFSAGNKHVQIDSARMLMQKRVKIN